MAKENIIEVKDLKVAYGDRVILNEVDFSIKQGEIFVIVGGSGCGKSTLLRQLIGLEEPTSGEVNVLGKKLNGIKNKEKIEIQKKFGILFQSSGLFASMTLEENIKLLLENYTDLDKKSMEKLVEIKLDSVGLNGYQEFLPSEISGGMKKRAGIARAMALDPEIMFFDEPSSGLDPLTSASLDQLILELNKTVGSTMVIVTHDLASVMSIADRIIMLDKSVKGIIAEGSPDELLNYKDSEVVYNFFNRIAD